MRVITLEEHFATPLFLEGPGQDLKKAALKFEGRAMRAFLDQLPVSAADHERIAHGNAEKLFGV
jgi:hypothetical protein